MGGKDKLYIYNKTVPPMDVVLACEPCGKEIHEGTRSYGCRICNWDSCESCHKKAMEMGAWPIRYVCRHRNGVAYRNSSDLADLWGPGPENGDVVVAYKHPETN